MAGVKIDPLGRSGLCLTSGELGTNALSDAFGTSSRFYGGLLGLYDGD
jgi:hypothetical protein